MVSVFINNFVFVNPIVLPWYLKIIPHFTFTRLISILTINCFYDRCIQSFGHLNEEAIDLIFFFFFSSTIFLFIGVLSDILFINKKETNNSIFRYNKQKKSKLNYEIKKIIENKKTHEYALIVSEVEKTYNISKTKKVQALKGVDISIKKGEIFGLLGPNGAGKTSLLSIITGSLNADSGKIFIGGKNISKKMDEIYSKIGVCPQFDNLWSDLTIEDHFLFYLRIRGIPKNFEKQFLENIFSDMKLKKHSKKKIRELSGGMKRRVSIGIAVSGNTELIFLDEPTTGLDPINRIQIWKILLSLKNKKSILLTTHLMDEAERLCQRIGVIDKGEIICLDFKEKLKENFGNGYCLKIKFLNIIELNLDFDLKFLKDKFMEFLLNFGEFSVERNEEEILYLRMKIEKKEILKMFENLEEKKKEFFIFSWSFEQSSLKDVFINAVQKKRKII